MLLEIAQAGETTLSAPKLALGLPRVGLGLAEVGGLNLGQGHAVGDRLIQVHEQLPNNAREGGEHTHRRILIPD